MPFASTVTAGCVAHAVGDRIMMDGNDAADWVRSTVVRLYAPGIPLRHRPQRKVLKIMLTVLVDEDSGKKKFAIIQAEDELAAAGVVIGNGNGVDPSRDQWPVSH